MNRNLQTLLNPKSIALIGASNKIDSVGYRLLNNIINGGYGGKIYPINPKYDNCQNLKCYKSINDLPQIPQLVIIAIPAKSVFETIVQCKDFGVQNFYIITSGFGELNQEGKLIQQKISDYAKDNQLNIIGPNTIGFVNNKLMLNANFGQSKCKNGSIALLSQSGAYLSGIMNIIENSQIGLKYAISFGNACDVKVHDLIECFNNDKDITQILMYLESIPCPKEFMKICKKCNKKIICIKSGRSAKGASAASSHTGTLASSDVIVDSFLKQCGVMRVDSISQMVDLATIFATTNNFETAKNAVIITNAGGPAIMAVDALSNNGIDLYNFTDDEKSYMKSYLQSQASVKNPVDMVASASVDDYKKTLEFCINNEKIDAIICIHLYIMGTKSIEIAEIVDKLKEQHPDKLIMGIFITHQNELLEIKNKVKHLPIFDSSENIADALKFATKKIEKLKIQEKIIKNKNIDKIILKAKKENRELLTTYESLEVLKELKLPLVKYAYVKDIETAKEQAKQIGYPVVVKITSKTITHKSDVGGVKVGIQDENQLVKAFEEIHISLEKNNCLNGLDGFIIQQMKSSNREFVYGIVKDSQFDLCSMFGLGGILVEALKDVCFKVLPTSEIDIENQIKSLKSSSLLNKIRNLPPANLEVLKDIMLKINNFALSYDIKELDLNPILIEDKSGEPVLIDARIKI